MIMTMIVIIKNQLHYYPHYPTLMKILTLTPPLKDIQWMLTA